MSRRVEIAEKYVEAQRTRDAATIDTVARTLAEDATLVTRRGTITGKAAIVERLRNPASAVQGRSGIRARLARFMMRRRRTAGGAAGMLGQIRFGAAEEHGETVSIKGELPANLLASALTLTFTFDPQDRLKRIEQSLS